LEENGESGNAISVAIPTTVFNLPIVYVTAEDAPAITATTVPVTATASSDPLATNVFDSADDVSVALSSVSVQATASATGLSKRAATCVLQPSGISYNSSPDTAAGFIADPYYNNQAALAATPSGWVRSFSGLNASNSADNYLGFTLLLSYDVQTCTNKCSAIKGCNSVNIFYERDPSSSTDGPSCLDPPSSIRVKCVYWGGAVVTANANNYGQTRGKFQVLVAGSNGYMTTAYAGALATQPDTTPPSTATGALDNVYNIYAASDLTQGAYTNTAAPSSYKDCITACDTDSKCNAFTYVGGTNGIGSGTCWLKAQAGSPSKSGTNVVSGAKNGKVTTAYTTTDPVSYQYHIQVSQSGTSADGKYIFISGNGGQSSLVSNPADATKFVVDQANQHMVVQSGSAAGYAFAVAPTTITSPLYFAPQNDATKTYFTCNVGSDGSVACSVWGRGIAGTVCSADNYSTIQMITGDTWPSTCIWVLWSFVAV
ncbi:hypothetical protein KCU64_g4350, partial [Aureobasidium melanogenum]